MQPWWVELSTTQIQACQEINGQFCSITTPFQPLANPPSTLPRPTAEILCVKDKSLSAPTHDIPIGQNVMYREPNDRRWYPATVIQQVPEKRSYLIKTHDNVIYRKTQVHLKPYIPKNKIQQPKLSEKDNNQHVNINQRPKHTIKQLNRFDL